MEFMGWDDLNWLEDVHMGYEEGQPAIFDRNINGWVRIPASMKLPDNQQDRDMLARELLVRFQTSPNHPLQSSTRRIGSSSDSMNRCIVLHALTHRRAAASRSCEPRASSPRDSFSLVHVSTNGSNQLGSSSIVARTLTNQSRSSRPREHPAHAVRTEVVIAWRRAARR